MHFQTRLIGNRAAFGWRKSIASEAIIVTGDIHTMAKAYQFGNYVRHVARRYHYAQEERSEVNHRIAEFLGRCYLRFNYVWYDG